ncbi:hypothetical protein MBLNU459_g8035t1 [Dothideomycetes sp. NU459]
MSEFRMPGSSIHAQLQRPTSSAPHEISILPTIAATLTSPAGASESGYSNVPGTPEIDIDSPVNGSAVKSTIGEGERVRPKQKRNKPTLSCEECVERKTKCDRGRPVCLACMKRQSECRYTQVANLIATVKRKETNENRARYVTKPPSKIRRLNNFDGSPKSPLTISTPSNIFGIGTSHPFANYWTCEGGLPEVIGVLPSKEQADILVAKYFECVDPVYPFLHKPTLYATYEKFWALPLAEKQKADADMLAIHFVLYALGTQFMQFPAYEERTASAEFYASAANQALRIYSYLNRSSIRAVGAMILLGYFLMNDNHASDAYAWGGILLRQTYALRLHRDPDLIVPNATPVEKHTRRKFWQAVFFQDTFLTVLLKLPPTATHSDVSLDALQSEAEYRPLPSETYYTNNSRVENLMSINVIAPPQDSLEDSILLPYQSVDPALDKSDVDYIKTMWRLGHLVQENLSSPLSLALPISGSPRQKATLIASFRALYRSSPTGMTTLDYETLQQRALSNPRGVRQNLFFNSNYHHCLMLLQASENPEGGVECNVRGCLEAAREAIWSYFKYDMLFEVDAGVWWVLQHRAFEEALMIADMLSSAPEAEAGVADAFYMKCKEDVHRMMDLLDRHRGSPEMKKTRREVLQAAYERMLV